MRFLLRGLVALMLLSPVMSAGCGDSTGPRAPAFLTVRLHDAPGDVQVAVVTIDQIYLQGSGGRTVLRDTPVTVDLTTLTNTSTLLVDNVTVPSGTFEQLRFVISGAYLQVEGASGGSQIFASSPDYAGLPAGATVDGALQMPSFSTSGLKVIFPQGGLTLPSGSALSLMVDFDVSQSFGHLAGSSDMWVMHPVIMATGTTLGTTLAVTLVLGSGVTLPTGVTLGDFRATLAAASPPGTVLGEPLIDPDGDGTFSASFGFVAPGDYLVDIVQPAGLSGFTVAPAVPFSFTAVAGTGTTLAFTVR